MAQDSTGTPMSAPAMVAWVQLMAQAMQGAQEAQKALTIMVQSPELMANFQKWLAIFAPGIEMPIPVSQPELMTEWLETWQKAMGVVPRTRYLELLEKADALERRVRELEETNRQFRAMLLGSNQQEDVSQTVAEFWGQMVENGIKTQAAWMKAWSGGEDPGEPAKVVGDLDEEE
jgi:hypothetical protein